MRNLLSAILLSALPATTAYCATYNSNLFRSAQHSPLDGAGSASLATDPIFGAGLEAVLSAKISEDNQTVSAGLPSPSATETVKNLGVYDASGVTQKTNIKAPDITVSSEWRTGLDAPLRIEASIFGMDLGLIVKGDQLSFSDHKDGLFRALFTNKPLGMDPVTTGPTR